MALQDSMLKYFRSFVDGGNILKTSAVSATGVAQTINADGSAKVADGFIPSQYDTDLTMDGTAQSVALAAGVNRVYFANQGATTKSIRVAFGTSAANAESNLNIAAGAATTGHFIGAAADVGSQSAQLLGVPSTATHYAVANAVAADVQVVSITQGI